MIKGWRNEVLASGSEHLRLGENTGVLDRKELGFGNMRARPFSQGHIYFVKGR